MVLGLVYLYTVSYLIFWTKAWKYRNVLFRRKPHTHTHQSNIKRLATRVSFIHQETCNLLSLCICAFFPEVIWSSIYGKSDGCSLSQCPLILFFHCLITSCESLFSCFGAGTWILPHPLYLPEMLGIKKFAYPSISNAFQADSCILLVITKPWFPYLDL